MAHKAYPEIPIINYNWDFYGWAFDNPRGYDWVTYGEYLQKSIEVWNPSDAVINRTEEFYPGIKSKCQKIITFGRFFDFDDVKDGRYLYNPIRDAYQSDPNYGNLKRACAELQIPLIDRVGQVGLLSEEDFQRRVAHCSFMVCELNEMSTGGLTLLEGHRLGKSVLISDSKYMGARDYFGDRAIYFKDDDYEDFKQKLADLWNNTPTLNIKDCKNYVDTNFSLEGMVDKMHKRLVYLKESEGIQND